MNETATSAHLDARQLEAVHTLRGPVVIHAGAGAGKTRTITHRIAHGVNTGTYAPQRVMAVTFTRKAAYELQNRLHALGVAGAQTRTFHSAALAQLGYFWPRVVGGNSPEIIHSKVSVLSQVAAEMQLSLRHEVLGDLAGEVEWRKASMLNIDEYAHHIERRGLIGGLTAEQMLEFQEKYEHIKQVRKHIDFEDVLILMTGMLEQEPFVAHEVRERYRFFTVDEYQDISPLQHALLRTWLGERNDVCAVGDPSQTIYSFAGASSGYLLGFTDEFPQAKKIELETNYRSQQQIVHVANTLMRGEPGALHLHAHRQSSEYIPNFAWFQHPKAEAEAVAEAIQLRIKQGVPPHSIAVLYRSHGTAVDIEHALAERGVHTQTQGDVRFFDRAEVKRAVMEIRAQAVSHDERPVFQVVSDVLRAQGWTSAPPQRGGAERERWETLNALLRLLDEQPQDTTLREFSAELLRRSKAHHEPRLSAVTLSTVHAAKGLEWPHVWLIGAVEGGFPISYAQTPQQIAEERRLFYVAVTRAQDELRISGSGLRATPSRFIELSGLSVSS